MNNEKLKSLVRTILAIESLEYENKNFLSGDNKSRCEEKLTILTEALEMLSKSGEVEITNNMMSTANAGKSMQFDCPDCSYNQIKHAWNYVHNYCPHCGVKLKWNVDLSWAKAVEKEKPELISREKIVSTFAEELASRQKEADRWYYVRKNQEMSSYILEHVDEVKRLAIILGVCKEVYDEAYKFYDFRNSGKKDFKPNLDEL